jgi:hypothetical protein
MCLAPIPLAATRRRLSKRSVSVMIFSCHWPHCVGDSETRSYPSLRIIPFYNRTKHILSSSSLHGAQTERPRPSCFASASDSNPCIYVPSSNSSISLELFVRPARLSLTGLHLLILIVPNLNFSSLILERQQRTTTEIPRSAIDQPKESTIGYSSGTDQ